jgi:hypothetical protein
MTLGKIMKRLALIGGLIVLTISSNAFSQNSIPKLAYGGFEAGWASAVDGKQSVANSLVSTFGGVANVSQDSGAFMGRIFGGYNFTDNVGAEIGYTQSGNLTTNASGVSGNGIPYTAKGEVSVHGLDYALILRPNISTGWNGIFFKLGGTSLTEDAKVALTAFSTSASASNSISGAGTIVAIGYDFPTTYNVNSRVSYSNLTSIAGTSDTTSILSLGFVVKF